MAIGSPPARSSEKDIPNDLATGILVGMGFRDQVNLFDPRKKLRKNEDNPNLAINAIKGELGPLDEMMILVKMQSLEKGPSVPPPSPLGPPLPMGGAGGLPGPTPLGPPLGPPLGVTPTPLMGGGPPLPPVGGGPPLGGGGLNPALSAGPLPSQPPINPAVLAELIQRSQGLT